MTSEELMRSAGAVKPGRAIFSLTNKKGSEVFAALLAKVFGVEIVSTGGTAEYLASHGVPVRSIENFTGWPEMLGGRVKTLHPKIAGGILYIRGNEEHERQIVEHGIEPIDMVVVNFYDFDGAAVQRGVSLDTVTESIDIGGPAMVREGAKNFRSVSVVTSPAQYMHIIDEMRASGGYISAATRFDLMRAVFMKTSAYDAGVHGFYSRDVVMNLATGLAEIRS